MKDFSLVLSSLYARGLSSILSILLTAFGVMMAVLILMIGHHVQSRMRADGQGVDLVLGAKGSPLQIVLSSLYHVDIPTGNMPYDEALKWMHHPQVKYAIPLALGDNYRGSRIVGSTPDLITHYGATFHSGGVWNAPMQAVVGAEIGLNIGDQFSGAHGLVSGGHVHEEDHYKVVGVMNPTGSVIDRLIITSLDSVLEIHGLKGVEHHHHHDHEDQDESGQEEHGEPEITAVLLKMKSPVALLNFPHLVARQSSFQAANPALEMARLSAMMGLGSRTFGALSVLLIVVAGLSIFSGLAGTFQSKAFDLALLRALGYSRIRLMGLVLMEGLLITLTGLIIGLVLAFLGFDILIEMVAALNSSGAKANINVPGLSMIVISVLLAGVFSAMLPAWRASRIDVADQLAKAR